MRTSSRRSERIVMLVLGTILLGCVATALGQVPNARSGPGPETRVLYANAGDVTEGQRTAEKLCGPCHGPNGVSSTDGIPHLAGQRPVYLYAELRAYQSGARAAGAMRDAVRALNDEALLQAAAYYASLDPAPPQRVTTAVSAAGDPLQSAKAAVAACGGCHGDKGVSTTPGTPSLAGLDPEYLTLTMKEYKTGARKSDVMKPMMAGVNDGDLGNIALYYALQKPGRVTTAKGGDATEGKAASAACAGCHGARGIATVAGTPSLAGQDAEYLAVALAAYKSGERTDEAMKSLAAGLSEAAMRNLAAYFSAQTPQGAKVVRPLSTADWIRRCDRCHGTNGNSNDPALPALAAQRVDYLAKVLDAYRTGARKSASMAAMAASLSEADVKALAAFYARQKPRAVVFVLAK